MISFDVCAFVARYQTLIFPFMYFFSTRAQTRFEIELTAYTNGINLVDGHCRVKKIGESAGEPQALVT
jgi:hypothetical protein